MSPASVLCAGQAVFDHVFLLDRFDGVGHKHLARGYRCAGGGVAATAAVAVARLDGTALLVGCVGDDAAGAAVLDGLIAEHVDVRWVRTVHGLTTPVSAVIVTPDGERTIVNHTPSRLWDEPVPDLSSADVDAVLADSRWPTGATTVLGLARRRGVPGVVDVDFPLDDGEYGQVLLDVATHVVMSHDALTASTGTDDPDLGLRRAPRGAACLAVTCGAQGVFWLEGDRVRHQPAFHVDVVDTTGAGDAFHGALALALGEGHDLDDAFRFASAVAAIACTRAGGREGLPGRAEVETLVGGAAS